MSSKAQNWSSRAKVSRKNRFQSCDINRRDLAIARWFFNPIEQLESRVLLSVTASSIVGPITTPGTQWNYLLTGPTGVTSTFPEMVVGPATFDGQSVTETETGAGYIAKSYEGTDAAGDLVSYGNVATEASGTTVTTTYDPYQFGLPATIVAGTPYSSTDTETTVTAPASGSASTNSDIDMQTVTLVSETTVAKTEPAGTYQCYQVNLVDTYSQINSDGSTTPETPETTTYYYAAGIGAVEIDLSGGGMYQLSSFSSASDQLAFVQQPNDTGAADAIKPPVKVAVEDASGNYQTTATGSVTLALNTVMGTGTLAGTLTEPVIGGFAIFSDLSVSSAGQYSLSATDSATPTVTPGTSVPFNIADNKLVFKTVLTKTDVREPLAPTIVVYLEDAKGKVITTDSSTVVTLDLASSVSGTVLDGDTQDTLIHGVARFSKVSVDEPGSFTLEATDGSDATAYANIVVSPDTLYFAKQPSIVVAGKPFPVSVELLNAQHRRNIYSDTYVQVSLNIVTPGTGAALGGTTILKFVSGLANFSGVNGLIMHVPGVYTLTATEESLATGILTDTDTSMPILSDQFNFAEHLVFQKQPARGAKVTVNTIVPFTVALQNKNSKTEPDSVDQVQLDLYTYNSSTGAVGATAAASFSTTMVNGIATFSGIKFSTLGSYYFQATEYDGTTGAVVTGTSGAASHPFAVTGQHLGFILVPKTEKVGIGRSYAVSLKDGNGVTATSDSVDHIILDFYFVAGGVMGSAPLFEDNVTLFRGIADFKYLQLNAVGTYIVVASEVDSSLNPVDTTTTVMATVVVTP